MKNLLTIIFLTVFSSVFGQVMEDKRTTQGSNSLSHVNDLFAIHFDSIERRITLNKWGPDTSCYLHYSVKSIARDTLIYVTNSCFYYNHYLLKIGKNEFDLNPNGGCVYNAQTPHSLASGESINISEWIVASNLSDLNSGEWVVALWIPLIKITETTYRVDGRAFVENKEYLVFDNLTKVVETIIYNRKRK